MGKEEYSEQPKTYRELWPGAAESFPWMDLLTAIPSPIFLVTTVKSNGMPNATLQSWSTFFSDSGEFLCIMGSVRKTYHLYENLTRTGECVINFPSASIYDKCSATIRNNVYEDDEIAKAGLTAEPAVSVSVPRIAECFLNLECEYLWEKENFAGGSHVSMCVRVKHSAMDPEYFDEGSRGRYGKSGYIYNIHQPCDPEPGEYHGTGLGAIDKQSRQE
jgi:flavin reductase (DIM6/NTAB) family NADH-FMN oxidoreductase RutF